MKPLSLRDKPALYAITDEKLTPNDTLITQVESALKSGVEVIQYRNKTSKDEDIKLTCKKLQSLCERYNATFIINDRVELACLIKAHGLHVGKDDGNLEKVREKFGGILGVSCYGDIHLAKQAITCGADYVAFGSFFHSLIKPNALKVSLTLLKEAKKLSSQVAVIGGINEKNISQFLPYDVDMICAISAIFSGDIEKNVTMLREKIDNFKKEKNA